MQPFILAYFSLHVKGFLHLLRTLAAGFSRIEHVENLIYWTFGVERRLQNQAGVGNDLYAFSHWTAVLLPGARRDKPRSRRQ